MRILHAADIHVTHRGDKEEQAACLAAMVDAARVHEVDLICLAGDFVEPASARVQAPWERETWRQCLQSLAQIAPILMIRGNHDIVGDVSHFNDIPNVTYRDAPGVVTVAGATVVMLPYRSAADWAAEADGPTGPTATETAEARMRAWLQRVRPTKGIALAMFHGALEGCTVNLALGATPRIGHQAHLRPEDFDGYHLAMLGDIHLPQQWEPPSGGIVAYPGSPWPMSHGEEGVANRGVLIWTVEEGRGVVGCERVRLPYSELRTGELEWADGELRWADGVPWGRWDGTGALGPNIEGQRIRLKVRYPKGVEVLDVARLEAQLREAGAKSVRIDRVTVQDAVAKVPELATPQGPTTLHGKLQAVFASGALEGPTGPEQAAWLLDACEGLENTSNGDSAATVKVAQYLSIELRNLGRWQGQTMRLDLSDLQGLIRLDGRNGSGKTTIMAWLGPALAYLECPNRGDATGYAGYGESHAEVEFVGGDGAHYKCRVEIVRRTVTRGAHAGKDRFEKAGRVWRNGAMVEKTKTGGISAYEAYMRGVFGDLARFYLQVYAVQRSAAVTTSAQTSFSEADPRDRDSFFRSTLDLDLMGDWERQCGERAKAALAPVEELQRQEAALQERATEAERLEASLAELRLAADVAEANQQMWQAAATKADEGRAAAQKELDRVRGAAARASALQAELQRREVAEGAAADASKAAGEATKPLEAAQAAAQEAERTLESVRVAAGNARAALDALAEAKRAKDAADKALDFATARKGEIERAIADAGQQLEALRSRAAAAQQRVAALSGSNKDELIAAAEGEVAAASKRRETLLGVHSQKQEQQTKALAAAAAAKAEHLAATTAESEAGREVTRLQDRLRNIEEAGRGIAGVGCAGKGPAGGWLPCPLIASATSAVTERPQVQAALEAARSVKADAARQANSKAELAELANKALEGANAELQLVLLDGKAAKAELQDAEGRLAELRSAAASQRREFDEAKERLASLQKQIADSSDAALRAQLAEVEQAIGEKSQAAQAAAARLAALPQADDKAANAVAEAERLLTSARAEVARIERAIADAKANAAAAVARLEALRSPEAIQQELDAAAKEAEGLGEAEWTSAEAESEAEERAKALAEAIRATQAARTARDTAAGKLEALKDSIAGLADIAARLDVARREHHWWSELQTWVRRLATLTIEAAAPELAAYVNNFLNACFGERFIVRIEAETENRSNTGVRRTYETWVTDTHSASPEERPLTSYSGGEQNPVRQALSFGLMLFSNHKSPRRWGVAFVDEADGGLDPAAQLLWQQMLCRFIEFGGMNQVFVVTHMDLGVADHKIDVRALEGSTSAPSVVTTPPANNDTAPAQSGLPF